MLTSSFSLKGQIKYYNTWVLAWLPKELDSYYRSLLPKAWYVRPPMNPPHVSIVRVFEEPDRARWGEFEGQDIVVDVFPEIQTDGLYFWLDCLSDEVGFVRRTLGLSAFRPDYNCYHITVGNLK
jgi:hypothetical protein